MRPLVIAVALASMLILAGCAPGPNPSVDQPDPDGRVLYSFGPGLPTVVCAPLRVCIVEMLPGERLVGEPHIGDAVRWNIAPASFGGGGSATTVVIIKPQEPGLDTNLLLTQTAAPTTYA